jgi:hypothetical protein
MAMAAVGVIPEHFTDPEEDHYWKLQRVSLAPVMAFWVGVSSPCPERPRSSESGSPEELIIDRTLQILYVLFSITRAGNLIKFLSHSVMTGFTSAAGLYIGISQIKFILGIHLAGEFKYNYMLFNYYGAHGIAEGSK